MQLTNYIKIHPDSQEISNRKGKRPKVTVKHRRSQGEGGKGAMPPLEI